MAAGDLLGIATSGLLAYQRSLATAGHNISNVNTEGYSRQRVELSARQPQFAGNGFIGSGVQVDTVRRLYDEFVTTQILNQTASYGQMENFYQRVAPLDNILADPQSGISAGLARFFDAVQGVADDPTSVPARQVLLSEAGSLVNRFQLFDQQLNDIRDALNQEIRTRVENINSLAASVARLNDDIALATGAGNNPPPNDLLDQRDLLIKRLAEQVAVTTQPQDDGALNVFIGNGQTLVIGARALPLSVLPGRFDPAELDVGYGSGGGAVPITAQLSGGALGGLLQFRSQVLDSTQNTLGQIAVGLSSRFNDQQRLGMDLNGNRGDYFFSNIAPTVAQVYTTSSATVGAAIIDVGALTASDYRLDRSGASYTLTRLSDGSVTDLAALGFPAGPVTVDGLRLSVSAGIIADGDSFLIRPTRGASRAMGLDIQDTAAVAAAAPIRTQAAFGNTGSGVVSAGVVNSPNNRVTITFTAGNSFDVVDNTTGATLATGLAYADPTNVSFNGWTVSLSGAPVAGDSFVIDNLVTTDNSAGGSIGVPVVDASGADPNLTDPVTITFNDPPNSFNVAGATSGSPVLNVPYTPGQPLSFNGWTLDIRGTPAAGDSFSVSANTGGVSDNRNALLLAGLQDAPVLAGNATFEAAYGRLVADVGSATRFAESGAAAQKNLLDDAVARRESLSGVNLDEEAANLVKFQQAYEASARVVAVAGSLFDTLISAIRG